MLASISKHFRLVTPATAVFCWQAVPLVVGVKGRHKEMAMAKNTPEMFWEKVSKKGPDECWLWTGAIGRRYGNFSMGRGNESASHRIAWTLTHGKIENGLHALHKCDTPLCCNPNHLFLGTHKDNMRDCVSKGRCARGERGGSAKLTTSNIMEIRNRVSAGEQQKDLADRFGLCRSHVSRICGRKKWKHI